MRKAAVLFCLLALIACDGRDSASRTPPPGSDPATVTDAQIYREFEVCMNDAKKTVGDDKMKGQAIAANCILGLTKYGDARAKKAFAFYFDLKE